MKIVFWLVLLGGSTLGASAQSGKKEDVVYLKNAWVIRGKILNKSNDSIQVQTTEGNIFSFSQLDVFKVTSENRWSGLIYKRRGFASFTELGPLIAGKTTIDGVTTAAFSFQTINGFKFSQKAFLGLGVGADLYAIQTIVPVFLSFRGDLSAKGTVIPYYFANIGYGVNITATTSEATDYHGGIQYALGIGIKVPFNRSAGFLFSAGYCYQATSITEENAKRTVNYNRLAVRAGFFL